MSKKYDGAIIGATDRQFLVMGWVDNFLFTQKHMTHEMDNWQHDGKDRFRVCKICGQRVIVKPKGGYDGSLAMLCPGSDTRVNPEGKVELVQLQFILGPK